MIPATYGYARVTKPDDATRSPETITTSASDGPEFQEARGLKQDQVTNAFVDPTGEPEVLVVVDMLLTGFDAPVEQVLYLDRALRAALVARHGAGALPERHSAADNGRRGRQQWVSAPLVEAGVAEIGG